MGFIFGLLVGGMIASGGGSAMPPMLGSIPFRCLAAFDVSEADYRDCRSPSLGLELGAGSGNPCEYRDRNKSDGPCSFSRHMQWEITGLREMKKAVEQKQATVRP